MTLHSAHSVFLHILVALLLAAAGGLHPNPTTCQDDFAFVLHP